MPPSRMSTWRNLHLLCVVASALAKTAHAHKDNRRRRCLWTHRNADLADGILDLSLCRSSESP